MPCSCCNQLALERSGFNPETKSKNKIPKSIEKTFAGKLVNF